MWHAWLDESQAGIKIGRKNTNNLRYADDTTQMAESKEEIKSFLMGVKTSEKAGLKLNIQKKKIMASGPMTSWQIDGETMETVTDFLFLGSKIIADGDCRYEIKSHLLLGRKPMTNLDSVLKSRHITLPTKVHIVELWVFQQSCTDVRDELWKGWELKNWCFWTVVLEKTPESSLDCKEMKPVNPKGNQPWIFIGRTDAEAEVPVPWLPDVKSQLTGKDPNAGKDWGQEKKGTIEDDMVGWHHWVNGYESEQT